MRILNYNQTNWGKLTMKFWVENRVSGIGNAVVGTFDDAMKAANRLLYSEISLIAIWDEKNEKIAEIRWGGPNWIREDYR